MYSSTASRLSRRAPANSRKTRLANGCEFLSAVFNGAQVGARSAPHSGRARERKPRRRAFHAFARDFACKFLRPPPVGKEGRQGHSLFGAKRGALAAAAQRADAIKLEEAQYAQLEGDGAAERSALWGLDERLRQLKTATATTLAAAAPLPALARSAKP